MKLAIAGIGLPGLVAASVLSAVAAYAGTLFGWLALAVVLIAAVAGLAVLHRPVMALWLIVISLPVVVASPGSVAFRVGNYMLPFLLIASWSVHALWSKTPPKPLPYGLGLWLVAFLFWVAMTVCFAAFPDRTFVHFVRLVLLTTILVFIYDRVSSVEIGRMLTAYSFVLIVPAVYGLWQIATLGLATVLVTGADEPWRQSSIYHNPNTFGVLMANGLVIQMGQLMAPARYRAFTLRDWTLRSLRFLSIFILLLGLVISFSRSSYLYFGGALLLLALTHRVLRWVLFGGLLSIVAIAYAVSLPPLVVVFLRIGAGLSFRGDIWLAALEILLENPWTGIGSGAGVFEEFRSYHVSSAANRVLFNTPGGGAHNLFLGAGAETGWIGLVLVLILFVMLWKKIPGALRRYRTGDWLAGTAAAGVFGLSIHGLFESGLLLGRVSDSLIFVLFALVLLRMGKSKINQRNVPKGADP